MNYIHMYILIVLILGISCVKKKTYTPAEILFINQTKTYERKINDYLFEVGNIQWRINEIMDKHNNNPDLYLADITYQTLIKQKDGIVGKSTHGSFVKTPSGTDMNINIINIGVDQDNISSVDLSSMKSNNQ